jgi:UDP-N-acetyl-D-galactosamine dehydrogenase
VGGHCIGVDPYYLTYKAYKLGIHAQIISSGRKINDSIAEHIAKQTVKKMIAEDISIKNAKVLVMGATFKENVSDIRNSKVADVIKELKSYGISVDVIDPYADSDELNHEYGFKLTENPGNNYSAIVVAVNHNEYCGLSEDYFMSLSAEKGILIDVKGIYRNKIQKLVYWSL